MQSRFGLQMLIGVFEQHREWTAFEHIVPDLLIEFGSNTSFAG